MVVAIVVAVAVVAAIAVVVVLCMLILLLGHPKSQQIVLGQVLLNAKPTTTIGWPPSVLIVAIISRCLPFPLPISRSLPLSLSRPQLVVVALLVCICTS